MYAPGNQNGTEIPLFSDFVAPGQAETNDDHNDKKAPQNLGGLEKVGSQTEKWQFYSNTFIAAYIGGISG